VCSVVTGGKCTLELNSRQYNLHSWLMSYKEVPIGTKNQMIGISGLT
jgi:hypothetical protein